MSVRLRTNEDRWCCLNAGLRCLRASASDRQVGLPLPSEGRKAHQMYSAMILLRELSAEKCLMKSASKPDFAILSCTLICSARAPDLEGTPICSGLLSGGGPTEILLCNWLWASPPDSAARSESEQETNETHRSYFMAKASL